MKKRVFSVLVLIVVGVIGMAGFTGRDNGTNGDSGNTGPKQLIISGLPGSSVTVAVYQQGTADDQAFISQTGFIAGYNGTFNASDCIIDLFFNGNEYWRGTGTFDVFIKTEDTSKYKKEV